MEQYGQFDITAGLSDWTNGLKKNTIIFRRAHLLLPVEHGGIMASPKVNDEASGVDRNFIRCLVALYGAIAYHLMISWPVVN